MVVIVQGEWNFDFSHNTSEPTNLWNIMRSSKVQQAPNDHFYASWSRFTCIKNFELLDLVDPLWPECAVIIVAATQFQATTHHSWCPSRRHKGTYVTHARAAGDQLHIIQCRFSLSVSSRTELNFAINLISTHIFQPHSVCEKSGPLAPKFI